jgi:1-acyl-sn-glycerol-3-phosphate acyltransferase
MLDLKRMSRITLSGRPRVQRLIAQAFLAPNYKLLPGVQIILEGLDNLPDGPVIFAMNHTDRYNYWPFQYQLWHERARFTATWVKGKYYEHPLLAWFMEVTNNIPTISRGYLIARDFKQTLGRAPNADQYKALRDLVDENAPLDALAERIPSALLTQPRDILGRPFHPAAETYDHALRDLYQQFMRHFVALNKEANQKLLDVIIFPEGTRSIRLSRGHIGIAQLALKFGLTIVPVGCNGCDLLYPASSPWARAGRVTYRVGAPITPAQQAPFLPPTPFTPFDPHDENLHRQPFQKLVDLVMDRINDLLDPRHRYSDDKASDGVSGSDRFI